VQLGGIYIVVIVELHLKQCIAIHATVFWLEAEYLIFDNIQFLGLSI
jgi:hypothetical protein